MEMAATRRRIPNNSFKGRPSVRLCLPQVALNSNVSASVGFS